MAHMHQVLRLPQQLGRAKWFDWARFSVDAGLCFYATDVAHGVVYVHQ